MVERRWIREFVTGDFHGPAAPPAWRRWVETNTYVPRSVAKARTSDEQHPDSAGHDLVEEIVAFCADDSSAFERCAAALWRMTAPATHDLVPPAGEPTTTGDWTGRYLLGPVDDPMALEFGLAARCHRADDPIRASDVLPLLVTVRDRRAFGVFVTTSFFEPSIHRQVRESGYPPTLICGKDISLLLRAHGYTTREKVRTRLIRTPGT